MQEFETQLKNAQNVKLTESERNLMRANIVNLMHQKSPKSPYSTSSYFMNPAFSIVSAFVFIIIGGAGVSLSAADALPGDFLYKIKVNVNEEVAGVLISSPKQKLIWQEERIQKRISEIHTLAESGELTKKNSDLAVKALDTNIAELNENATELAATNPEIVKAVAATIDKDTEKTNTNLDTSSKISTQKEESDKDKKNIKITDQITESEIPEKQSILFKTTEIESSPFVNTENATKDLSTTENNPKEAQVSEEAKDIAIIETQISILKVKIAKEKEHLESLTAASKSIIKSDSTVIPLDTFIQ